ncbi:hypothetical protein [Streptomyces sp. NPDC048603]|uniref:hypothetical protein n=1 Tax=Streptomyces sp. NPDC048603 TaxID=3365577 RepID=UPI00371AD8ED
MSQPPVPPMLTPGPNEPPNTLRGIRDALEAGQGHPEDLADFDAEIARIVVAYGKRITAKKAMDAVSAPPGYDPDPEDALQITSVRQGMKLFGGVLGAVWKEVRAEQAVRDLRPQKDRAHERWEKVCARVEELPMHRQEIGWRKIKQHLKDAELSLGELSD